MHTVFTKGWIGGTIVVALFVFFGAFFMVGIRTKTYLETNLDKYMPSEHPAFVYSDQAEELFGIKDAVLIAIEHPTNLYNTATLTKIRDITLTLPEVFPEINADDITSLYTVENITADEWGLTVESFYRQIPQTQEDLDSLRRAVAGNSMVRGKIVSDDERTSLIIAEIGDEVFSREFYTRLQAFAHEQSGPEIIHIAGRPVVEGEMTRLGPKDLSRMAPLVFGLMAILLLIIMRSLRSTLINLGIVTIGTLSAFGVMAWIGIPMYTISIMIPVMLIAIGVADGIHLHNAIMHLVRENPDIEREILIAKTMKAMTRPVIMTSVTTAVGFLSLLTSQVLPVRYFGLFTAIGVMVEMVGALLLFPAFIRILGVPKLSRNDKLLTENAASRANPFASKYASFILARTGLILVAGIGVLAIFGMGSTRLWIDTSFLSNFQKDSDIVLTDNFVNEHFGGTSTLNVIFSSEEDDTFKRPEVLNIVSDLQAHVVQKEIVGKSFGLTDYITRMHRVMHDDNPAYEAIPDEQDMIAQYLLLYEMSGDPENLNRVIDYGYREANLAFQLKSDSSADMKDIITVIKAFEPELAARGVRVRYAGSGYKSLVFSGLLLDGQITGLLISFLVVFLLLTLMFKNAIIGLVGSIPIAFTAVINFGTMGLTGIPLSSSTAIISGIAIGIGVDYAIHYIDRYLRERAAGADVSSAAISTIGSTGRSIIQNATAVIGGFSVLLISLFPPNRQVGALVALNMGAAAIATLTLLVVVLAWVDRKGLVAKRRTHGGSK